VPVAAVAMAIVASLATAGAALAADPTVAAVGDMACSASDSAFNGGNGTATRCRQTHVSDLLVSAMPSALLDLGDNQYVNGALADYRTAYDPTFGRANAVVYPSLGNAEYGTAGAQGFFDYFAGAGVTARITGGGGDAAHFPVDGYYSFDIGAWHVIALNSNCADVSGGCAAGSPQETWLKADLAAHPNLCTLAYWHHPRWNSGLLGNDASTAAFWTDLYNAGADVVLNGHGNHHYERFAPRAPNGTPDAARGIREFIVSTGGESHGTVPATPGDQATSEVTDYTSYGLLRMTLQATGYAWRFVPEVGGSFTDSGTGVCHASTVAPAAPVAKVSAGDGVAGVSWTTPPDGGSAITAYRIYRGTSAGGETLLASVGDVTSYSDSVVTNGTRYFYRVSAVNGIGEGAQSDEVSATPQAAGAFPATGVLDGFARASGPLGPGWQSPGLSDSGTVSIPASGQTAGSAGAASATWSTARFGPDQEAYLGVPVLPRAGDWLQVAGRVSVLGSGGISCYILRVTPSTGVWDLRRKINGATSTSMQTFSAPLTAGDTVGLRINGPVASAFRKPAGGGWTRVGSTFDTAVAGPGYVAFTLGDTAIRGGAFGGGTMSTAQPPAAPGLSASGGDGVATLSWSAPADGGSPITSYRIYRGPASGTEALLATVGNATGYADGAVSNGTTYFYRVAAVNGVGEGIASNEASATPRAAATFPTTGVLDGFARPAGPLGTAWQSPGLSDTGTVAIAANGQTASSAGTGSATWSAAQFGADQEAYLVVPVLPRPGGWLQVAGRVSVLGAAGVSCYLLRVTPSTSTWDLRKKLKGATSTSMQAFSAPLAAGDTVGLELRGPAITAYRMPAHGAWAAVGSVTDTAIAAGGYVSFSLGDTTIRGGPFGGGAAG
jgi:hypothetical protein